MTDAFAELGLDRRLAPDADSVREAYRRAAEECHPDHADGDADRADRTGRLAARNEARAILLSPSRRIRHWLALEHPDRPAPHGLRMDDDLMDVFALVGGVLSDAAKLAARKREAATNLAKAAAMADAIAIQERIEAELARTGRMLEELEAELAAADSAGQADPERLAALGQRAAFLEKWRAGLQGAFASLI